MPKQQALRDPGRTRRVATKLSEIPTAQLACRSGRHLWPSDELEFGKPLPKGMTTAPAPNNCQQLIDKCRRCGKRRVLTTRPGGVMDPDAQYDYYDPKRSNGDPDDWVKLSRDLEVTRRQLKAYNIEINAERLFRS
jgi:hypothetical protein